MHIHLDSVGSTSTWLAANADGSGPGGTPLPHGTVVSAREQSAGRGQRGNSWESLPGANATLSVLLRDPGVPPARQFIISQAVSLALAGILDPLVPPGHRVCIKWPNDIYVDDLKIGGILIETAIERGRLSRVIAGIGLNVNQPRFTSQAPNPVSLIQLTGRSHDVQALTLAIGEAVTQGVDSLSGCTPQYAAMLHSRYHERLWRADGNPWPYLDHTRPGRGGGSPERIMASIAGVAPTGHMTLRLHPSGQERTYAFKEITALLTPEHRSGS